MLNSLRNAARGTTAKVLLLLLVASFAVWGVSGAFSGRASDVVVAAGETTVGTTEYALSYQRALNDISRRFGTRLSPEQARAFGIDQIVLSELVSGAVLDEQARVLDLGISEDELVELLRTDPAFQDLSGRFDRTQFRNVLSRVGLGEEEYLHNQEAVARRQQLVQTVSGDAALPAIYSDQAAELAGQTRDVTVLRLTEDILPPADPVDDTTLAEWFEENRERFERPEYRRIEFVELTPDTLADPSAIADEAVRAAYRRDLDRFTVPASRDVQRLLFDDRATADAALARLNAGEVSFDGLIAELGVDPQSILIRGVTPDTYPDADAAGDVFALNLNQTSDVIETRFGPAIVRPVRVFDETVRSFEDVADDVRRDIALSEANAVVNDVFDAYIDERAGGATFREAAAAQGLEVQTVSAVARDGTDANGEAVTLPNEALIDAAFDTEIGQEADPLPATGGGNILYEVPSAEASRPLELNEARDRVLEAYNAEQRSLALAARAAELERQVRDGDTLEAVAAEIGIAPQAEFAIRRTISNPKAVAIFGGADGHVALVPDGDAYELIRVDAIAASADRPELPAADVEGDLLQQLVADLQAAYRPTFDDAVAQRALSR